ncbi:MAG: phasin family protein [Novosphingobium sp.]|nr:phasin family protein [Novosphingobium sp.]
MTLRQTLQAAPTKSKDLIDRLAETSNQAVKTREALFGELSDELTLYLNLEERHLFPVLGKTPETKALTTEAIKSNKELRDRLGELAATPKDSDAFAAKVAELKTTFQQHQSNARKRLTTIVDALGDEQAEQIAAKIDEGIADAQKADRELRRNEAEARRREREATERAAEAARAALRAERAAAREVGQIAERAAGTIVHGVASAEIGVRRVASAIGEQAQNAADAARETITTYTDTARNTGRDLKALGTATNVARKAASEITSAWFGWVTKTARVNVGATRQLLQCRSVRDLAELHRDVVSSHFRDMLEGSKQVLDIAAETARQAIRPLDNRLAEGA